MRLRSLLLALLALLALAVPAAAFSSDFEHPANHTPADAQQVLQATPGDNVQRHDTPNDKEYDQAENDSQNKTSTNIYDERFDLFGFPSQYNTDGLTTYKDPADLSRFGKSQVSGFNAAGAWKLTRGDSSVGVAILDTGIKWSSTGLRTQVRLNKGELPEPQHDQVVQTGADCATLAHGGYDANGDGAFDVDDYACDSRLSVTWAGRHGPAGRITGEDLIHAFSTGAFHGDDDHNGFVDDIAGWDFFNNDNDPFDQSSYFAASNHGSGRTGEAVERGNDNDGSIGVCPHCQFLPIRVWDTFVSDGDTFGLGIFYAAHMGVKVIEGSDGNLYHSKFTEAASQYAYKQGITQTYSGDDLNTANHNYPANYNHVMEIQGTVPDTVGLGSNQSNEITQQLQDRVPSFGTNVPLGTYFRGANTTQFGGHSSISMEGPTGSTNTGKASGALALVIAAAREHDPSIDLSADEAREIVEQTAEDVTMPNTTGAGNPDPAAPGWDSHFGYGRADIGKAVSVAASGKIPPEASIDSPDWYAPVHGQVHITGLARASRASGGAFHWKLETCQTFQTGTGDASCTTAAQGDDTGSKTDFGNIDADQYASSTHPTDTAGPSFALGTDPFKGQFTVRLTVTDTGDASVLPGVDRKILTAVNDSTTRAGFPKRMGTGGEAPIRYADLNGDNVQELIVPLEDGKLHALEPNGLDLQGWPASTQTLAQAANHAGALNGAGLEAPLEPLRGAVVADIDGDGKPEVIDTAGIHLYVWEADGKLRPGFPASVDLDFCKGQDQSQPLHHRKCGFLASPALGHVEGKDKPLDIVASALDGHVYVFRNDGSAAKGYPTDLVDPGMADADKMFAESINNPAVGDLDGDGYDDIAVASNESYDAISPSPSDLNGGPAGIFADVLQQAGGTSRAYAIDGKSGKFRSGWPIKLPGAIQSTLPLVGPGHDAALAKLGGQQTVVVSTTGGALSEYDIDGKLIRSAQQDTYPNGSNVVQHSPQLNLFESASVGDLIGTGPALVKYGVTVEQAANLLLVGQNAPYSHVIGAYDGQTGAPLPAYPTTTDDYQFLSSSNIAKVASGSTNQILAGTGLGLLHAYDGISGQDAAGFPKVTGGWLFAPAALSTDHRIADITREGYLFEWNVPGAPACQPEWPSFRHDDHQTGNYDADGTAPAAFENAKVVDSGGGRYRLTFKSPGDDGFCGTAKSYDTESNGEAADIGAGQPVAGGSNYSRDVTPPKGATSITLRTRDEAGNLGFPVTLALPGGPAVGPPPTPAELPLCTDRIAPSLALAHNGLFASRRRIAVRGTGRDTGCKGVPGKTHSRAGGVRRVLVAVAQLTHSGCRFIDSKGHLGRNRSCRISPHFLPARGTTSWSLRLRGRFARGTYAARFRIYDIFGNVGRPQPRRFRAR